MGNWKSFFKSEKKSSAATAKERLMVAVAYQRSGNGNRSRPVYLEKLQNEILDLVRKYVQVPDKAVQCQVENEDGMEILEVSVTLNEQENLALFNQ